MGTQDSGTRSPLSFFSRPFSLDTWSVAVALALAALVRLGLIKTVPW
jgi:hypothetical protein